MEDIMQKGKLSDIFAYTVPKKVILRDSWLGGLNLVGVLVICLYFVVDKLYLKNAYLELHPLVGTTDIFYPSVKHPKPKQALPYCTQYDGQSSLAQEDCVNLPKWDIVEGSGRNLASFTTRIYDARRYDLDCMESIVLQQDGEEGCRRTVNGTRSVPHYVANVEDMTLAVRHLATPATGGFGKPARSMDFKGRLHCADKSLDVPTGNVGNREYDWIDVHTMLSCVGVRLDDTNVDGHTFRFAGIQLLMEIDYTYNSLGKVNGYNYFLTFFPLKALKVLHDPLQGAHDVATLRYPASRSEFEARASISIEIQVKGKSGAPAFDQFMISWVSTMALMGITPIFVGFLMHRVHPLRSLYSNLISQRSLNFTKFRNGEPQTVEAANEILRANALSRGDLTSSKFSHPQSKGGKYHEERFVEIKTASTHVEALELRLTALEDKINKVFSPATGADSAGIAMDVDDWTAREMGAQTLTSHQATDGDQKINTRVTNLEKSLAEFAIHMRDSHLFDLPRRPNEVGIDDVATRVREIQAQVTKLDGEVQRIECMEQQFAAASNHWIETERKLAGTIESMRAQPSADHLRAVIIMEINKRMVDLETRMAESTANIGGSHWGSRCFNIAPMPNEVGIGDMESHRSHIQAESNETDIGRAWSFRHLPVLR